MTTKTMASPTELLDQAAETYFNAVKSGLKLQEEVASRWAALFKDARGADDWQSRFQSVMKDTIPHAQQNTEEALKIVDHSTRQSLDLLAKAFEAGQSSNVTEAQEKLQDLWKQSLEVLQKNAQTMIQVNEKIMQGWVELVKKNLNGAVSAAKKVS